MARLTQRGEEEKKTRTRHLQALCMCYCACARNYISLRAVQSAFECRNVVFYSVMHFCNQFFFFFGFPIYLSKGSVQQPATTKINNFIRYSLRLGR